jgi:anti-sigma factor RsiW
MTCEAYEEQISALIDHELADGESMTLFEHLSTCQACRHSLQSVLDLRSDLGEQSTPIAPKELDEKVLQGEPRSRLYAGDRSPMRLMAWKRRISMPVPVAAAIMVVLIASSVALSSLWSKTQTVYITALPVVEVHGYMP